MTPRSGQNLTLRQENRRLKGLCGLLLLVALAGVFRPASPLAAPADPSPPFGGADRSPLMARSAAAFRVAMSCSIFAASSLVRTNFDPAGRSIGVTVARS